MIARAFRWLTDCTRTYVFLWMAAGGDSPGAARSSPDRSFVWHRRQRNCSRVGERPRNRARTAEFVFSFHRVSLPATGAGIPCRQSAIIDCRHQYLALTIPYPNLDLNPQLSFQFRKRGKPITNKNWLTYTRLHIPESCATCQPIIAHYSHVTAGSDTLPFM